MTTYSKKLADELVSEAAQLEAQAQAMRVAAEWLQGVVVFGNRRGRRTAAMKAVIEAAEKDGARVIVVEPKN